MMARRPWVGVRLESRHGDFCAVPGLPADMFEIGVCFFQTDNIAVFVVNVEKAGEVRQFAGGASNLTFELR